MDEFEPEPAPPAPAEGGDDPFAMPAPTAGGGDDPFGLGPPPADGGMDGYAPPLGGGEEAMPASEPLPTFGEPEPTPMPAAGGLGADFAAPGALGPLAEWRIQQQEKVAAKAAAAE